MALTTINSSGVKDDSIVNADIKSDAAIAGTKVAPDFGSQNIITTGKCGIGTALPAQLLHLEGASPIIQFEDTDNSDNIYSLINGGGSAGRLLFQIDPTNEGTDSYVRFDIDGSEKLRITSDGKVGIGVTPVTPLHLEVTGVSSITYGGGSADTACLRIEDNGSNNSYYHGIELRTKQGGDARIYAQDKGGDQVDLCIATDNSGIVERLRITSDGNCGLGISSPTEKLHVIGQVGGTNPTAGSKWDIARFVAHDYSATNSGGLTIGAYWNSTTVSGRKAYIQSSQNTDSGSTVRELVLNPDGGNVSIGDGDLVLANTHGINFSASSNQAGVFSGGETLTDYEVGLYTPNLLAHDGSWSTVSLSSGSKYGSYVKIGNMVHVQLYITDFHVNSDHDGDLVGITLPIAADSGSTGNGVLSTVHSNCFVDGGQTNFFVINNSSNAYGIIQSSTSYNTWKGDASRYLMVAGTYRAG